MADARATLPKTLRSPGSGGCGLVFASIFLLPAATGAYRFVTMELGQPVPITAAIVGSALTAILGWIYYFFNSETRFLVDSLGITVSRQSTIGPFSGKSTVDFEARWDRIDRVVDVTQRRLTKNGNMMTSYKLLVGEHEIHAGQLGTMERDGLYLELIEAIRAAIGDRLVAKEDLGDLEAPIKRLVEERIAKAASDSADPKA